ncbi:hypothetical protein EV714DRAFT_267189 [Schizophyllum commune]
MSSTTSSACIVGMCGLENPRPAPGGGWGVLFDAVFQITPGTVIVGVFRYFNKENRAFPDAGRYFVHANFAAMNQHVNFEELKSDVVEEPADVSFIGDIEFLRPVQVEDGEWAHRPIIHASGRVAKSNRDTSAFEVTVTQYTSFLKNRRGNSTITIQAIIPDSPRYPNGRKPIPHNNTFIHFHGHLGRVYKNLDGFTTAVSIDVEDIAFLGQASTSIEANPVSSPSPASAKKRKFKTAFTDTDDVSEGGSAKKRAPSTPLNTVQGGHGHNNAVNTSPLTPTPVSRSGTPAPLSHSTPCAPSESADASRPLTRRRAAAERAHE